VKSNFERMLALIDETFATRNDPGQIQVSRTQMKKLQAIHPATLSEMSNENGPLIWVLLIPTVKNIMQEFLQNKISEAQLLKKTKPGQKYDCIYLCSATSLPEARAKGQTKALCVKAIQDICKDHPVDTLFAWPFTKEGGSLADKIAGEVGMTLLKKK
jgi:hypothetical protein